MSIMLTSIGNITDIVNGFHTDIQTFLDRSKYRTMLQSILDRIEKRLDALKISAAAASLQAGLSDSAIRNIQRAVESGREGVSTATIIKLAPVLRTTAGWLIDGSGYESIDAVEDWQQPLTIAVAGALRVGAPSEMIWTTIEEILENPLRDKLRLLANLDLETLIEIEAVARRLRQSSGPQGSSDETDITDMSDSQKTLPGRARPSH